MKLYVNGCSFSYGNKFENKLKDERSTNIKKGIENVCKYRVNELLVNEQSQHKTNFISSVSYINHKFLWKFRFINRIKKSFLKIFKKFDK